ncbi:MAG: hypothetical protein ACRDEA_20650, partial [Microcystaceae cyanobacterium]
MEIPKSIVFQHNFNGSDQKFCDEDRTMKNFKHQHNKFTWLKHLPFKSKYRILFTLTLIAVL